MMTGGSPMDWKPPHGFSHGIKPDFHSIKIGGKFPPILETIILLGRWFNNVAAPHSKIGHFLGVGTCSKPRHWMWLKFLSWLFETSLLELETRVLEAQLGMLLVSWVWTSVGYPNSRCFLYWKLGVFQDMFVHGVRFGKLQLDLHPSNSKKHNAKPGFITIFPESLDYHDDWW